MLSDSDREKIYKLQANKTKNFGVWYKQLIRNNKIFQRYIINFNVRKNTDVQKYQSIDPYYVLNKFLIFNYTYEIGQQIRNVTE